MATLFVLLLLIAFGFLIWSLVAPAKVAQLLDKQGKYGLAIKNLGTGFGGLAVVFFVLVGVTAPPQSTTPTKTINLSASKAAISASTPAVTTKTVTETETAPYSSTTVDDSSLAKGTSKVTTAGVNGVETLTYKETFSGSKQTAKTLVSDTVTTQPVTQVTSIGTYVAPTPSPAPAPSAAASCTNGTYVNSAGNTVCSPESSPTAPAGATAQCVDGTYSFSQSHSGTCSHHGGVAQWL